MLRRRALENYLDGFLDQEVVMSTCLPQPRLATYYIKLDDDMLIKVSPQKRIRTEVHK